MIAPARARRPGAEPEDFPPPSQEELDACPFCEGREERTPPESLAVGRDDGPADGPGWRVRVVPNLYPAFERQEVVIHAPRHARSLVELSDEELELVARAWRSRAGAAREAGFGYVQALVNEGRAAGASLSHSHSQLVWLRSEPPVPMAERSDSRCRVCALAAEESAAGTRVVADWGDLLLFCPPAGRAPYELMVAPHQAHKPDAFAWEEDLARGLALAAEGLRRVHAVAGPSPANAWLHTAPFGEDGHWHIEIVPRLTILAGMELGAGIYVNPLAPEDAAGALRQASARRP